MNDDMVWYFVLLSVLLCLSVYFLMKYYIKFSQKHQIIAHPTSRSAHQTSTPTGGGIVFAGLHIVFLLLALFGMDIPSQQVAVWRLCVGGVLIIILGIIDDKYTLRARRKLLCQIIIALIMIKLEFSISVLTNPFGEAINLNLFSIPATVIWYLLVMNAVNFIDGLDGLAAGIAIISCLVLLFFSFSSRNFFVFINCFYLLVSLCIFLSFNYPKAKLFMGDTGSLFIGFLLASLSIAGNEKQFKGLTTFTLLVPMTVLFVPIIDAFFTIVRRFRNHQPLFKADKKHLHHKLVDYGISKRLVSLICWFITLIFGILALGYIYTTKTLMIATLSVVSLLTIGLFFYIYKKELFK